MLEQLIQGQAFIDYILEVEVFLLCILQMRTNRLIRKSLRTREQKKEKLKQLKEEIKNGESEIPVVKFKKEENVTKQKKKESEPKGKEGQNGFDPKEVAVLQELLTEYFG